MTPTGPKTRKELRQFGGVMAGAFSVIAAIVWWKDGSVWPHLLGVAAFFGLTGLVVPSVLRPIEWAWMKLALVLGAVMTRVILTVAYIVLITPLGLLLRLMGKDLLRLRPDPEASTYWEPPEPEGPATRADKPY